MPSNYVHRFNVKGKVKKPFVAVSSQIRQFIENPEPQSDVLDELERIGTVAIIGAANRKGRDPRYPGNITTNQYDAYAYMVFFNGKLMRSGTSADGGKGNKGPKVVRGLSIYHRTDPDPKTGKTGAQEARDAIGHFKTTNKGYTLVLLNAMWYSSIHERGWSTDSGWHQFNVITLETKYAYAEVMALLGRNSDKITATIRTVNTKINK